MAATGATIVVTIVSASRFVVDVPLPDQVDLSSHFVGIDPEHLGPLRVVDQDLVRPAAIPITAGAFTVAVPMNVRPPHQ